MGRRFVPTMLALLFAAVASADSWTWSTRVAVFKFADGLTFEYHARPFQRAHKPRTVVLIMKHGTTIAQYSGLGFETVIASPHGNLFVALANSELSGTAVAVFAEKGNVILHASHTVTAFPFCEKAETAEQREWYDSDHPDVQFDVGLYIAGITLNDCCGERINLLRTVTQAMAGGADRIETRVGRSAPSTGSPSDIEK